MQTLLQKSIRTLPITWKLKIKTSASLVLKCIIMSRDSKNMAKRWDALRASLEYLKYEYVLLNTQGCTTPNIALDKILNI